MRTLAASPASPFSSPSSPHPRSEAGSVVPDVTPFLWPASYRAGRQHRTLWSKGGLNMAVASSAVGSFGRPGGALSRRPAAWVGLARALAFPGWAVLRRLASLVVIALAVALLSAPHTEATPLERSVRRIAETVLGEGTVQVVQVVHNGRVALVRWEAATYEPENPLAVTREILYGEAELTTGAVIARLPELIRIRFAIVHGKEVLAQGETGRGGLRLVFGSALGGGTYIPIELEEETTGGGSRTTQVR